MAVPSAEKGREAAPWPADVAPDVAARLTECVLLRCAIVKGAKRTELHRDVAPLFAVLPSALTVKRCIDIALAEHLANRLIQEFNAGRYALTDAGHEALVARFPAVPSDQAQTAFRTWGEARDVALIARCLACDTASSVKALRRPDGASSLVVQRRYELTLDKFLSHATLRASLAVVALERAFGNRIKTGLGPGAGLSAKAGRTLAAQLLAKPRTFQNDGRLILALAADATGAKSETFDAVNGAVIASWVRTGAGVAPVLMRDTAALKAAPNAANDASPIANAPPFVAVPPDLQEFAGAVLAAARSCAEGWPGNRKAFISRVWHAIRTRRPEWNLNETVFKAMLAEAHRAGRIVLASGDLKSKETLGEFEASAVLYKNTAWHFVRIEE